jgi:hypothetical protein
LNQPINLLVEQEEKVGNYKFKTIKTMKKILILFTSILILSCNNSNQNKNSVDSIPMTKINESSMNE